MKYLALLILASIIAGLAGFQGGCSRQDSVTPIAYVTVDLTWEVLSKTYALQSAKVQRESCLAYGCESVYDCPSLEECPAQKVLTKAWDPVWTAYESVATAVELGDSDSARKGYCQLKVAALVAGVALPKPVYACEE